jgi:hypothetical protein
MNTYVHLWYLTELFLEWKIFQTKVVEKIEKHIYVQYFFLEKLAIYEITWKNLVEPDMPQIIPKTHELRLPDD